MINLMCMTCAAAAILWTLSQTRMCFADEGNTSSRSATATTQRINFTLLDDDAIGYGTFQSHNQKVIANEHGIFTSHIRTSNHNFTAQQWRLSRSTDGGKTFTTLLEGTHDTAAPVLETDKAGNIYMVRCGGAGKDAFLYFLAAPNYDKPPRITFIPGASAGKYTMALDEARGRLYFLSQNEQFFVLSLDGKVLSQTRLYKPGTNAYVMYPSLTVNSDGAIYAGLTTQEHTRYNYWDIHWIVSRDGGATWQKPDGTKLQTPVVPDDTGPADRLTLDDEFKVHTWLSSWLFANGRVHSVYWGEMPTTRQRYLRLHPTTGRIEVDVHRIFGDTPAQVVNDAGLLSRGKAQDDGNGNARPAPLYFVSTLDSRSRLACMVSRDNGQTWKLHAVSDKQFDTRVYSIGGYREVTPDGTIVGTFTVITPEGKSYYEPHSGKVYFFSIPAADTTAAE